MAAEPGEAASHPLHAVLAPHAVAVIGASADPTKRGYQAIRALRDAGFAGSIFPVNPRGGEILGLRVVASVQDLPGDVDLALVCTPAASIPGVLETCAAQGIRGAVVLALGFAESGEAGAALERDVAAVAKRTGIRVVGPNTSGILNLRVGLNLVGLRTARPGRIGILVQSGNVLLGLVNDLAARFDEGVSLVVGMGNQTDIGAREYLDYLDRDTGTKAIAMYVEGVQDGAAFIEVARRVVRRTPVVVLKGGRTDAGRSAARSHTGSIAGEYAAFRAALRQAGVVEATRTDELAALVTSLAWQPAGIPGKGVVVLSDGGGHATLAADALSDMGVPTATLSEMTRTALRSLLGPAAAVANPVDLAGASDRDPPVFAEALRIVLSDDAVGGVLVAGLFGGYAIRFAPEIAAAETAAAGSMGEHARTAGKPVVLHSLYATSGSRPIATLLRTGIPVIESLEVAARCIAALIERGRLLAASSETAPQRATPARPAGDPLASARADGRDALLETEARALVEGFGVTLAPAALCTTSDEAAEAASRFGGRLVLKAVSPAAPHKTEAGGVALGVMPAGAAAAFEQVTASVRAYAHARERAPDLRGVLVMPMLERPVAEVLVGVRRDPSFGPVLTVGVGGTLTELIADVALRVLPVDESDVEAMLEETRLGRLLAGWRGAAAADRGALVRLILAFADAARTYPALAELEANPVFAGVDGAVAVDVRGFLVDRKSLPPM